MEVPGKVSRYAVEPGALCFEQSVSPQAGGYAEVMHRPAYQPDPLAINQEATQAVLDHHLTAFGANDLDAIMEDYADEATLITPDTTMHGKAQISAFF